MRDTQKRDRQKKSLFGDITTLSTKTKRKLDALAVALNNWHVFELAGHPIFLEPSSPTLKKTFFRRTSIPHVSSQIHA